MNLIEYIIFFGLTLSIFVLFFSFLLFRNYQRRKRKNLQRTLGSYEFVEFPSIQFNKKQRLENQDLEWKENILGPLSDIEKDYDTLVLVHGTFVGNDVFGIKPLFENAKTKLSKGVLAAIRKTADTSSTILAGDAGRFTKELLSFLKSNTKLNIINFEWGSENHHAGRIRGLIGLIKAMKNVSTKKRILFVGHSHAGQLFALMSQLAHQNKGEIYDYFASKGLVSKDELKSVKSIKADFVTLGTPVRYKWAPGNYKLLHIVNHRGPKLEGIGLRGFQTSKYGDYIQIWGCYGSDFIANSKSDRVLNKELNELLEGNKSNEGDREDNVPIKPQSPGGWFKNIETKSKINHQGHTLLVNFEPKLTIKNNFLTTFFGHGVYMKHNNIAQLFKIISTHLDKFKNMNK